MTEDPDELPRFAFNRRMRAVARLGEPSCNSKGPHSAHCVRTPGHGGRWCEGNGLPDAYGPQYYRWPNRRHQDDQ